MGTTEKYTRTRVKQWTGQEEIEVNEHRQDEVNEPKDNDLFEKGKGQVFVGIITTLMPRKKLLVPLYLVVVISLAGVGFRDHWKDMMPKLNNGQFQVRLKEPEGTRLERTEDKFKQVLQIINQNGK